MLRKQAFPLNTDKSNSVITQTQTYKYICSLSHIDCRSSNMMNSNGNIYIGRYFTMHTIESKF